MLRARLEAGEIVTVQQLVHAAERVVDAELLAQNLHAIGPPQRTYPAIGVGRAGGEAGDELVLLRFAQASLGPAARPGLQRRQAMVPIGVGPPLDKTLAATEPLLDDLVRFALKRQQCRAVTVPLLGVPLVADEVTKLLRIGRLMR
jgi:hypothetical protein